jgi:hypothetical protein
MRLGEVVTLPYETGGRANKFGNRYESRWVVNQLLRLLKEEIASVTIEAIGEEEVGVDLWIKNLDESQECHQCKARNGSKEYWDLGDLSTRLIFEKAKQQLDSNKNVTYSLVSAVAGMMLNDLTIRAQNSNSNPEDFYHYQIETSASVSSAFKSFSKYMELNIQTAQGRSLAYEYLKRIHMVQYPDDGNVKRSLCEAIKYLFVGDVEAIYSLISNFPIENNLLGKEITVYMLNNYLEAQPSIATRHLYKDQKIIPRIEYYNNEFASSFVPINNSIIHRTESDECYSEIINGKSIIIHGKAGSGKSGIIFEFMKRLKKNNIVHFALKLDRRIPEHTSEKYGESLGLPASPIFCLDAISKSDEAVLILDQLDAIRWTNNHSRTALEVCKEMIREAEYVNKTRDKKLVLVFVCRTFDLKNDRGIKELFLKYENKEESLHWKEIVISEMDDDYVKAIVGDAYPNLARKLQVLLRTPSNLYIWTNIEVQRRINTYLTSSDLIKQWWEQLQLNYEAKGNSSSQLLELKEKLVKNIERTGILMIQEQLLGGFSIVGKEYLLSSGLFLSNGNQVGFVHQSFYDYFSVEKMLNQVYEGVTIYEIIGPKDKQTPMKRYHLQMFFENLLEFDMDKFIDIGKELLHNDEVRFYMKYAFLEVLSQSESISENAHLFLIESLKNDYWRKHIIDAVLIGHPTFIKFLIQEGYISVWLKSVQDSGTGYMLLRSINTALPDELTSLLCPFAFKDAETDNKIYMSLCRDIKDDSDNMFEFRLEIMIKRPELCNTYVHWDTLLNSNPERAIRLLDLIVKNIHFEKHKSTHVLDQNSIDKFIKVAARNPLHIWNIFMPYLAEVTYNITNLCDEKLYFWETRQYTEQNFGRTYVQMIKESAKAIIADNPKEILKLSEPYFDSSSLIVNEVLLHIMETLPEEYSDYALDWLMKKPYQRLFNYTGENDEYLFSAKRIIETHSKTCSDEAFQRLEAAVCYFHEEDELSYAKHRFDYNHENRKAGNRLSVYWPYWGKVQHYLIPALDPQRITRNTKELAVVLQRRFEKLDVPHKRSKVVGGWVGSTIGSVADKISDKQWLRIVENKNKYKHGRERWPKEEGAILESSPEQFARDLERIGEKDPNRIARIALHFSDDVDNHYINAIYCVIGLKEASKENPEKENWRPVEVDVAQQVLLKFGSWDDNSVATSFCRVVRNRADEKWNDEIINMLSDLAINHSDPEEGKMNVWSSEDKEGSTVNMLRTNSMNCVRGCAAEAIAALLWKDQDRYDHLKETVEAIVYDKHLAVNMAALECLCPIMNIKQEHATNYFFILANKDLRIVAHPYAYNLFYYLYKANEELIKKTVLLMYYSEYEDVSEIGARHVANMNLVFGCFEDIIFYQQQVKKTKAQKQGIMDIAIHLLKNSKYHDKCKNIIELFIDDEDNLSNTYIRILNAEALSADNDLEFIVKIVTAKANILLMHHFIDFLNDNDPSLEGFKDIILGMCQSIVHNTRDKARDVSSELFGIAPELSRLIASLYDMTQGKYEVNQQCLDMWDMMFESRIGTVRELSQSIMNC